MALKALIKKEAFEALPKEMQALYKAEGEDFVLDVDEKDYKGRLNEFRTNNTNLEKTKQQLEQSLLRFKDVDPEKYKEATEALEQINQLEEADLLKKGKFEEVVNRRLEKFKTESQAELKAAQKARDEAVSQATTYQNQLGVLLVDTHVTKSIGEKAQVRKGALDDVLRRARETWKPDKDGKTLIPVGPDGNKLFGKDGNVLTLNEWRDNLLKDAEHLFEASSGGGAGGGTTAVTMQNGVKMVQRSPAAIGANLKDIASGKAVVQTQQ